MALVTSGDGCSVDLALVSANSVRGSQVEKERRKGFYGLVTYRTNLKAIGRSRICKISGRVLYQMMYRQSLEKILTFTKFKSEGINSTNEAPLTGLLPFPPSLLQGGSFPSCRFPCL